MIPERLQKLILQGKAQAGTFVAGGAPKAVLNVQNDRFIIITSINYQSALKSDRLLINDDTALADVYKNTQVKIFSEKSNNTFVFRDQLNISRHGSGGGGGGGYTAAPGGSETLNTFLIHEGDVSFTFSTLGQINDVTNATYPTDAPAYPPPFDYGKTGQVGALPVRIYSDFADAPGAFFFAPPGNNSVRDTVINEKELTGPINALTDYTPFTRQPWSYPILNVQYVEIYGVPTDISGTY
jgi:hypothetical protein